MDIISAFRHSSLSSIQSHSDTLYIYIHNIVSIAALFHSHFSPLSFSLSIYAKWGVQSTSKCRSAVGKACELSLQKSPLFEKLSPLISFMFGESIDIDFSRLCVPFWIDCFQVLFCGEIWSSSVLSRSKVWSRVLTSARLFFSSLQLGRGMIFILFVFFDVYMVIFVCVCVTVWERERESSCLLVFLV